MSTALILEGYNNLRSFTGDHEFQTVPCNHGYSLSHVLLSHNLRGEKQPDVTLSSCAIYTFVIISCVCLMPRVCCYCSSIQKKELIKKNSWVKTMCKAHVKSHVWCVVLIVWNLTEKAWLINKTFSFKMKFYSLFDQSNGCASWQWALSSVAVFWHFLLCENIFKGCRFCWPKPTLSHTFEQDGKDGSNQMLFISVLEKCRKKPP